MAHKRDTSWGAHADWYDALIEGEKGTYHKDVILPNILRLMDVREGETVLDLGCGQGFFARRFHERGARVIGVDLSRELVAIARRNSPPGTDFRVASASNLGFLPDKSVHKATMILSAQNMDDLHLVFRECARVLKDGGRLYLVLNHPAFRIPRGSAWGWDDNRIQYRRVDRYLSESKVRVEMHPGGSPGEYTISFHRPLQYYFKALNRNGFWVGRLEEWISNRRSQPGPRAAAENRARAEIPLFLFMEAIRLE